MSAELLLNVTPSETRVAMIEGESFRKSILNVKPNAALLAIFTKAKSAGYYRACKLLLWILDSTRPLFYMPDIVPHTECVAESEKQQFQVRDISELVRQGQDIVVQVVKDPLGTKGARLTTDITLPSRYLVFMPGASHVGVSQRIESEAERERLKKIVSHYCDEHGGFIIRTAAEGANEKS